MSVEDLEVATRLAAIDSASIADGSPVDADTLRVLAMQSNRMRIEPSVIVNFATDQTDDVDYGRSFRLPATQEWKLLFPLRGPRRPIFNRAKVYLTCHVELANNVEFGFQALPSTQIQALQVDGSSGLIRSTTTITLPEGLSEQGLLVWLRGVGDGSLANAATIGDANTVDVDPTESATDYGYVNIVLGQGTAVLTNQQYTYGAIDDGSYSVRAVTSGGMVLWERRISHMVDHGDSNGAAGRHLVLEESIPQTLAVRTNDDNTNDLQIRNWTGRTTLSGLMVVGEVA